MLRVAGSLKLGALSASEFMRTIQSGSRTSTLVRAIAELGRIAKTLFFCWLTLTTKPIAAAS
jgi:TnpA family transposase